MLSVLNSIHSRNVFEQNALSTLESVNTADYEYQWLLRSKPAVS